MVSSIRNIRPRRRSRPRRMVSFSDGGYDDDSNTVAITICSVPSLSDLSEAEIKSIWYTQDEFRNIKKSCVKVLKKIIAGTLSFDSNDEDDDDDETVKIKEHDDQNQNQNEEEEETTRGLENKTPRGSKARQKNRFIAMDVVLDEQQRQWEQGKRNVDYTYVALLYHQSSIHCQEQAYLMGKQDAKDVHNYHRHHRRHHQDENENERSICVVGGNGKDNKNNKQNNERKEYVKNIVTDDKRQKKVLPSSLSSPLPTTNRPSAAA